MTAVLPQGVPIRSQALLRRGALTLLAAAALAACNKDEATGPAPKPTRAMLDGTYECVGFVGYTNGPQGPGYYRGNCRAYLGFANPTLADSGRTFPFEVESSGRVLRLDYPEGVLQYDTTAVMATITYPGEPQDDYAVSADATFTYFEQKLVFDFSGDGQQDTLYLTFANRRS